MCSLNENLTNFLENGESTMWYVDAEKQDPKYKGWIIKYDFKTGEVEAIKKEEFDK